MTKLIVVIDNSDVVRELTMDALIKAGYDAAGFDNPYTALHKITDGKIKPDFVIMDFWMPGMNGEHLLDEIRRNYPEMPGIIMTGSSEAAKTLSQKYAVLVKGKPGFYEELLRIIGIILKR